MHKASMRLFADLPLTAGGKEDESSNGSVQAFRILRFGFTVAPIIAGLDKFLYLLTDWDKYLAPVIPNTLGIQPHTFMMIVGAIEIVAGVVVAVKPRFGGYLVAGWLLGIIVNLLVLGDYFDVALRDFGLLLAALALARLAKATGSRTGAGVQERDHPEPAARIPFRAEQLLPD